MNRVDPIDDPVQSPEIQFPATKPSRQGRFPRYSIIDSTAAKELALFKPCCTAASKRKQLESCYQLV
jgi:hypothetical protein